MTNQSFWNFGFGRDPNLRASDADREAAAERIRRSHAEGRLDTTELQERLERCYEAKRLGELHDLVNDLPTDDVPQPQSPLRHWRWRLAPLVPILIALLAVCAVTGRHGFWLVIPLVFLFYRLCWRRWRPYRMVRGRGPGMWV
jgi:hypothetical protein